MVEENWLKKGGFVVEEEVRKVGPLISWLETFYRRHFVFRK